MIDMRNCDCMALMMSIPDSSIDLVVTDPPYIFKSNTGGGSFGSKHKTYYSEHAGMSDGITEDMLDQLFRVMKIPNIYLWGNWKLITYYLDYLNRKHPDLNTNLLTWHKSNPVPLCGNKYLNDTEYCIFARGRGVKVYGGYSDARTYWVTPLNTEDKRKFGHPTIKPESIINQLVKNSSREGDIVLDPFLGSGTTAKVCKDLGRNFIGSEIDKTYYETALKRMQDGTSD